MVKQHFFLRIADIMSQYSLGMIDAAEREREIARENAEVVAEQFSVEILE